MDEADTFIAVILIYVVIAVVMVGFSFSTEWNEYQDTLYGEIEGTIINKYYEKSYSTIGFFVVFHNPEAWYFELEKDVDGETKTITIEVTEDTYNNFNVGDYFTEEQEETDQEETIEES